LTASSPIAPMAVHAPGLAPPATLAIRDDPAGAGSRERLEAPAQEILASLDQPGGIEARVRGS
jgi:hypothetical protein